MLIVILSAIVVLCITTYVLNDKFCWCNDSIKFSSIITGVVGGIVLLTALILVPVQRMKCGQFLNKMDEVQLSIQDLSSVDGSQFEKAALYRDIVEMNANLVSHQYYANNVWLSVFYTDEFRARRPIRMN
jgi:hypothetical protein